MENQKISKDKVDEVVITDIGKMQSKRAEESKKFKNNKIMK